MAIQNEPTRIQIPFADSGTKNVIPDTNSTPSASQAASWTDGFPAQCSLPLSAGGIPPARADFNGIFNTMSQSIRYGQEGGVWAWDATVDYGTSRMVLGSDGKIYWSVAQSGPNVGGAQDPTADDGTYWSSMPMQAPGVLDRSDSLVTSQWVQDAFGPAPLYVDGTNGNDASDGLTQATAVQTIGRALALSGGRIKNSLQTVYIAGGSYTDNVDVSSVALNFVLQGNVSLTGYVAIARNSSLVVRSVEGENYKISISSTSYVTLDVSTGSQFYSDCPVELSGGSNVAVIRSSYCANATFSSTLKITASSVTTSIVFVTNESVLICGGACTLLGSGNPTALEVFYKSYAQFSDGFDLGAGVVTANGVIVEYSSYLQFLNGSISIPAGSGIAYEALYGSGITFGSGTTASISYTGSGKNIVVANGNSFIYINIATGKTHSYSCTNCASFMVSASSSTLSVSGSGTLTLSGGVSTATAYAYDNALMSIGSSLTVNGAVTGTRYSVRTGSVLDVNSAGVNRIPGSAAGTATAAQYAYYG